MSTTEGTSVTTADHVSDAEAGTAAEESGLDQEVVLELVDRLARVEALAADWEARVAAGDEAAAQQARELRETLDETQRGNAEPSRWDVQQEWAVEVTWRDWRKAGASGPTSQYGPLGTEGHRDRFLRDQRRSRDITATRVLTRHAAYTPWEGPEPTPTSEEEREALLEQLWEEINGAPFPRGDAGE